MTEETTADLPVAGTETPETTGEEVVDATTKDLKEARNAIIKAYFDKWDEEKGLWVPIVNQSLNVLRGTQKKKLLSSLDVAKTTTVTGGLPSEAEVQQKIMDAADTQMSKIRETTPIGKFRYEKEKMDNLKVLLSKSETELTTLKTEIDDGKISLDTALTGTAVIAATTTVAATTPDASKTTADVATDDVERGEIKRTDYVYPVKDAKINSPVGPRTIEGVHGGKEYTHKGVDIAAAEGTSISSIGKGKIESVGFGSATAGFNGYGNYMVVKLKNGYRVLYGHMSKPAQKADGTEWKKGDKIKAGEQVGLMGSTGISTGPHLHLEIRKGKFDGDDTNYFSRDYVDPISILPVTKDMVNTNILARIDETEFMDENDKLAA